MYRLVKNSSLLLRNPPDTASRNRRKMILEVIEDCMSELNPSQIIGQKVKLTHDTLHIQDHPISIERNERIYVAAAGKAAYGMAEALASIMGDRVVGGFVITPQIQSATRRMNKLNLFEIEPRKFDANPSHVIDALASMQALSADDLVIFLLSGGASTLLTLPVEDVSVREKHDLANQLLRKGAAIDEVNTVRKHLSQVKGGRLVKRLHPATVITLAISDVVGNALDVIGSGPTAPDPTTYWDAVAVLMKYDIWSRVGRNVRQVLLDGLAGQRDETPKPQDPLFEKTRYFVLADHATLLQSASQALRNRGVHVYELTHRMQGESRIVGEYLADLTNLLRKNQVHNTTIALLATGETTVTVRGRGTGGRNQELVLAFAKNMRDMKGITMCAVATDGIDGPTNAAGAIVDEHTLARARSKRLKPGLYLERNDSHRFFKAVGDAIYTGQTGTNLGDLIMTIIQNPVTAVRETERRSSNRRR